MIEKWFLLPGIDVEDEAGLPYCYIGEQNPGLTNVSLNIKRTGKGMSLKMKVYK